MIGNIRKILEMILSPDQADILNQFSKDTPHFILDKIKITLEKNGYSLDIEREDSKDIYLTITSPNGIIRHKRVSRDELVSGDITAKELIK